MRCCITSFAILLALIAFSPTQTQAAEPSAAGHGGSGPKGAGRGGEGGQHSAAVRVNGGPQGGDHSVGVGGNAAINPATRSNANGSAAQAERSHQTFDAHNRPEYLGGSGEGHDNWRYRWDNGRWLFWGVGNQWLWYGNDGQWQNYGNAYVVQRPIMRNFSGGLIQIDNPATNKQTLSYTLDGNPYTIAPGYSQSFPEDRAWVVQFSRGPNMEQARYGLQSGTYSFTSTGTGWELYRGELPQTDAPSLPAPPNPSRQ
jgi:hypothetical protein